MKERSEMTAIVALNVVLAAFVVVSILLLLGRAIIADRPISVSVVGRGRPATGVSAHLGGRSGRSSRTRRAGESV
jgi:hypothetical protein